jgi:hypothetical protein
MDDVTRELKSMKILSLYRVCGGTAEGRRRKVNDLAGSLCMISTTHEGSESAIWLFTDHDAPSAISWSKICSLTELGNTVGHWAAKIITLPAQTESDDEESEE